MDELNVGFSRLIDTELSKKAALIHTSLTKEPGTIYFPAVLPPMSDLKAAIDVFDEFMNAENTTSNVAERKAARTTLINVLKRLAAGLELTANGNITMLSATGFDLKHKPVRSTAPLPAPQNLRMATTGTAGEALGKCKAVPHADGYEAAWSLDPMHGIWTSIVVVSNSQHLLFTGLDRGKDYYFRVRAIGATGPSGWSDVATMMVV